MTIFKIFTLNNSQSDYIVWPFTREGVMAEWLGTGLQNLLQRFNSASRLQFLMFD